jgi:hypothetical protein
MTIIRMRLLAAVAAAFVAEAARAEQVTCTAGLIIEGECQLESPSSPSYFVSMLVVRLLLASACPLPPLITLNGRTTKEVVLTYEKLSGLTTSLAHPRYAVFPVLVSHRGHSIDV